MDNLKLAEILFPNLSLTVDDIEAKYPQRQLASGAMVTRLAPSPTAVSYTHLDVYKRQRPVR